MVGLDKNDWPVVTDVLPPMVAGGKVKEQAAPTGDDGTELPF